MNKNIPFSFRRSWNARLVFMFLLFLFSLTFLKAQFPEITVRFTNPQYDYESGEYCLDIEFQSDSPGEELFGMNVRFFYDNTVLDFLDFRNFEGGYGPFAPNPPNENPSGPAGPALFNFDGGATFINGAIQLVNTSATPIIIPDDENWIKIFQMCFDVIDPNANLDNFCPSIVWDLQENPANGGYLAGDDGVVMTVVDPDSNVDSSPADVQAIQYNWTYSGDGTTPPFGVPTQDICLNLACSQQDVLLALYNATNGPSWNNRTNWNNGMDPCNAAALWHGITCDGNGNITIINLDLNGLMGTIPPELECLTHLTQLSLDNNQLTGNIPAGLGNLSNLTQLSLNNNQLSCIESGLDALCGNTNVIVTNNPGNLDWDAFCTTGEGSCDRDVTVRSSIFLQGSYVKADGLMQDVLRQENLLPLIEPYTGLGYTHLSGGGESVAQTVFDISGPDAIVDWVFLELSDKSNRAQIIATRSALLQRDGDVVDVDGVSPVTFDVANDDYFLAVRHRNHVVVKSAQLINFSSGTGVLDFTSDLSQSLGGANGIANLGDGKFGLFSGDVLGTGQVQNTDKSNLESVNGTSGYVAADVDLNGQVQNTDLQFKVIPNIGKGKQF